jgi:hypothetical protein
MKSSAFWSKMLCVSMKFDVSDDYAASILRIEEGVTQATSPKQVAGKKFCLLPA